MGNRMAEETASASNTQGGRDRRTLRGLLIKPKEQFKYSFLLMGGGMLVLTIFIGLVIFSLSRTIGLLEAAYGLDSEVAQAIRGSLTSTLAVTFLVSAILTAFTFLLGIQLSHRIYGPLIPLQRHIKEMQMGNFASRVKLRKNDELLELQDSLNDLASTLQSKYGSSPGQ